MDYSEYMALIEFTEDERKDSLRKLAHILSHEDDLDSYDLKMLFEEYHIDMLSLTKEEIAEYFSGTVYCFE